MMSGELFPFPIFDCFGACDQDCRQFVGLFHQIDEQFGLDDAGSREEFKLVKNE